LSIRSLCDHGAVVVDDRNIVVIVGPVDPAEHALTLSSNRIRAVLKQFFPAAIDRTILSTASTPAAARRLTLTQLRSLLRRAGRSPGHRR
jgi:hypothetical protein